MQEIPPHREADVLRAVVAEVRASDKTTNRLLPR